MDPILIAVLVAVLCVIVLQIVVLRRSGGAGGIDVAAPIRDEFRAVRDEQSQRARELREEVSGSMTRVTDLLTSSLGMARTDQQKSFESVVAAIRDGGAQSTAAAERLTARTEETLRANRDAMDAKFEALRATTEQKLTAAIDAQREAGTQLRTTIEEKLRLGQEDQHQHLEQFVTAINALDAKLQQAQEKARETIDTKLQQIQEGNERKLEEMRQTVDEKLHKTLELRLGESFKLVSERLEAVQKGLGEMQGLASGVGDLKRVLTNVKARGTWGEFQLGAILEQILTPDQYGRNVQPTGSGEQVEFAVRLPGEGRDLNNPVWLPIDSKFPMEDYERLLAASQAADPVAVEAATKGLLAALTKSAKDIHDKYIAPPHTTDFGIMFLPTEGLYAEVLRQPGFQEELQRKFRVLVAGPTTLAAILNSLRVGFQTLAIEKRASEIWDVLRAVKTEFGKFSEHLARVKKQLSAASNTIEQTETRTRQMVKKLKTVEELPTSEAAAGLLGLGPGGDADADEQEGDSTQAGGDEA